MEEQFKESLSQSEYETEHARMHQQGIPHDHIHDSDMQDSVLRHTHGHGHIHSQEHNKTVINRLARAIGHLESVKRMVEDERDCSDVLIQIAAVRSALSSVSRIILKDHIEHCIVDAAQANDEEAIAQFMVAIDHLMKQT